MIDNDVNQKQRLEKLNLTARKELELLISDKNIIGIEQLDTNNDKMIENK